MKMYFLMFKMIMLLIGAIITGPFVIFADQYYRNNYCRIVHMRVDEILDELKVMEQDNPGGKEE